MRPDWQRSPIPVRLAVIPPGYGASPDDLFLTEAARPFRARRSCDRAQRRSRGRSGRGVTTGCRQRGVWCERGEERVPVAVVDGGNEPVHDGGWRVPGTSWVLLRGLAGEWPAEPDTDVDDDPGSDEAEGGGGDPLVGGGPCPADAVGVGGYGAVECERDQGGEGQGEGAGRCGGEPCRGPAVEQHGHDERGTDDAPAGGADGVGLPVRQVAEDEVGQCAQADDEGVAREQAGWAAGDLVDGPAAQGD